MTVRSAWHYNSPAQNPGQTRQDSRLAPLETPTPVDAMTGRSGVLPGGTGLNLTGSGMSGTISTGRAIIQGTTNQGAYPFVVTAAEPITVANGHASLPRIDSVFAVCYDQLYDSSGQTLAAIVYTQGTAASSPTAPTAPATGTAYLKLWDILVPAGASAGSPINWGTALTDKRQYTTAVGGITPGGSSVAGAFAGQFRDGGGTTGILERYNGTTWESKLYLGAGGQLLFNNDTNLYRSAAGKLKTDGSLQAAGMVSQFTESTTSVTVTSTTYTDSTTVVSLTVTVPPSGKVQVVAQSQMYVNASNVSLYSGLNVVGSVTGTIRAAQDATALHLINYNTGDNNVVPGTVSFIITSANPGETLTIKWQHRVTSNAGQIDYRNISAVPLLG